MTATFIDQLTIHSLVSKMEREFPDADPRNIAEMVFDNVPEELLREFCIAAFIPLVESARRCAANRALGVVFHPDGVPMPGGTRSTKIRKKQDAWQQACDKKFKVNGEWKRLGDCNSDDLDALIAERESHILDVSRQVEKFRRLKKLIEKYAADVVGEIPPTVAEQFLQEKS